MNKKKKAIYTSIIGSYDDILQPKAVDESFDYVLFVKKGTKKTERIGIWEVRELDYDCDDNTITSRFPKMNPHVVLPEYEYSLWIDGNIVILKKEFYDAVNAKIDEGVVYSGVKHPNKDCVYHDIEACVHAMRDKTSNIMRAARFLIAEKFPEHYGMYENNIILRKHTDASVINFCNMWWKLYLEYPRRDQFTSPYCLRANGLEFNYLLPEGECAKTSDWFEFIEHKVAQKPALCRWYDFFACRVRTYYVIAYLKRHGIKR
ncbi:MAG: DUF616 domain-containing protein [Prevotellaceae bacterium]|nr:DUF616 domain-containing protein [Candidatus Minthosoma caballi]